MRKYAFIPSRDGNSPNLINLKEYLTQAGFDVRILIGKESIFSAYYGEAEKVRLKPDDKVIMCHDDIEILNDIESFNTILDTHYEDPNSGFLGVAGSRVLRPDCVWWAGYNRQHAPKSEHNPMSGLIFHGHRKEFMNTDHYGPYAKTVILDGVFLATTGRVINTINLNKPKPFKSGWHFYDIYYTYQSFKKGYTNRTAPVFIRHESTGNTSDHYDDNREAFISKFGSELPAFA